LTFLEIAASLLHLPLPLHVDRVLVIGWRAQEENFLDLWAAAMSEAGRGDGAGIQILVVAEGPAAAKATYVQLKERFPGATIVPAQTTGFSDLMVNKEELRGLLMRTF
jgi:hypothetical protein